MKNTEGFGIRELPAERKDDLVKILDVLHREHAVKPAPIRSTKKHSSRAA